MRLKIDIENVARKTKRTFLLEGQIAPRQMERTLKMVSKIVPYAGHEAEWVLSQWHHAREYTISGHTVIIWDEDRDTRVFDAIPLFKNVRLIGEHEGCVNVLLPYAQRPQSSVPGYGAQYGI